MPIKIKVSKINIYLFSLFSVGKYRTNYGVNILNQKARLYTTKVAGRQWPLQEFYNILQFAVINAVIVYNEALGQVIGRHNFFAGDAL